MRKLKLQVQISADGFIAGTNHEMDWMVWNWDEKLKDYVSALHDHVDTILLGRGMTDGFVKHWEAIQPDSPEYEFAQIMVNYPKYSFSNTITQSEWNNTTVVNGDLVEEVNKLKNLGGKDLIVYGGANFDSSLIKANLVDEYYLFVNPAAVGKGLSIFASLEDKLQLKLVEAIPFECGIVLLHYERKRG